MLEYISDLRLFCAISKTRNFRKAGEQLGYSPAVVTMRVKRLEAVTGKTLFIRSTRHIKMTEEGHELLGLAEQLLDLTELMNAPRGSAGPGVALKGTVRITAPHSFARIWLLQPVSDLMLENPQLSIDLLLEDSITRLVREGIDISFRVGGAEESTMESRNVLGDRRIVVAAPEYIRRYGKPGNPGELKQHRCLSYAGMKQWILYHDGQEAHRVTLQNALYCNTGDYLSRLAVRGTGITIKSEWSVQQELASGELVRLLPEYNAGPEQFVRALTPRRDYTPARVDHVLQRIISHIQEHSQERAFDDQPG